MRHIEGRGLVRPGWQTPDGSLSAQATDGLVNLEADSGTASRRFPVSLHHAAGNSGIRSAALDGSATATANVVSAHPDVYCSLWQHYRNLTPETATVGETYAVTDDINQWFTYGSGETTSLGVGLSDNDPKGSFSQDGTFGATTDSGALYPHKGSPGSFWWRTKFGYVENKKYCDDGVGPYYQTATNGWYGGATQETPTYIPNTPNIYCTYWIAGSAFYKESTAAVTWTGSLGIPILGLGLSSETGYSTEAKVAYQMADSGRFVCGQKGPPGGAGGLSPSQLVVRSSG